MPDLDPGYARRQAERLRRYDEAMAESGCGCTEHFTQLAIDNCSLCDHDGYRPNGAVCDHIDRTDIARRGMEKVRAALAKLPKT
jgi:hypothetical protein